MGVGGETRWFPLLKKCFFKAMDQPVLWKVDGCSAACFSLFFWGGKSFLLC
ncbi:Uncharacterized protein APZ42_027497 [Daphnia magna]|uniref:Uncharacterized protein n=1 Tax=Daphnia magna TaxID=35525 RepID=A0A164RMN7_9CRUS|nr:Uncharacterized protein APZ42_027497 [Daphnia magna]